MSVIKSNTATIAVYYTDFLCMVTPKFCDCNPCACVKNSYVQNISKIKSQEHNYFNLRNKIYNWSKPQ